MIYGTILAGGTGKRMERQTIPKQFISIGGIPIIVCTLKEFIKNPRFDKIYIAVHEKWIDYMKDLLNQHFIKVEQERIVVVCGGKERLDSFVNVMNDIIEKNGLNNEDIIICHDSVRPFVSQQMINDCIDATLEDDFALTSVPTTDTIHVAENEKYICGTLDREKLYNGQTPSGFRVSLLKAVCDSCDEEEKNKVTGTTQLILKHGYKIRLVKGHTSNFKITTDNDLDIADRVMRAEKSNREISLLDCTLRDGGIVIDFDFGLEKMLEIKNCLEAANVEYIECGYIDKNKGSKEGRTSFDSDASVNNFLKLAGKKAGVNYVAMIDYGTYDVSALQERTKDGLDGIRLAFHKEKWREAIEWGKIIIEKGYDLYIQPMVSMRYDDNEFYELIRTCNESLSEAKGFYIVDSFGQMDSESIVHMLELADQHVSMSMKLGFHAHNNRQMAYANAQSFIKYRAKHDIMLDSSIMGMGKGAGNLCTELIAVSLVDEGKEYNVSVLYDIISSYFLELSRIKHWGYSLDYYLSSLYSCTPSYINIFQKDERVTKDVLIKLLETIPEEKKAACDKAFAVEHLNEFFLKNN